MTIASLIERLEKTSEPSIELFEAAYVACFGAVDWGDPNSYRPFSIFLEFMKIGAWTDAALTLVTKGWTWQVSNRAPKPHAGRAYIHNGELINVGGGMTPNPKYRGAETTAATPAIALVITALRTREAGEN